MGIPNSARARAIGVDAQFQDLRPAGTLLLPARIAVIGQGATAATYSTDKRQVTSELDVGNVEGFGSPLDLAVEQLLPANGDGVGVIPTTIYPLIDDGSGVAAAGDIEPTGSATKAGAFQVSINEILSDEFVIAVGDVPAGVIAKMIPAVNSILRMPMIAADGTTTLDLVSKWAGESSNGLRIKILGPSDTGITFAVTQPVGGLVNPDIQPALDQIGNIWETLVLNLMNPDDVATLDKLSVFNEGRWNPQVRKPFTAYMGNTEPDRAAATAVTAVRTTDKTNSQLVAPGSDNLPFVVAARELARIAVRANDNPARMYSGLRATGLTPGADSVQWDYLDRDVALKAGSSTIEVVDGQVELSNIVTMYAPAGEVDPAFRFTADLEKLKNCIFTIDQIFTQEEWQGAPLIPDGQATTNPSAKSPSDAVTAVSNAIDGLALAAIISDPAFSKASIVAGIDSQNPKRLNLSVTVKLSGNTNIIDNTLNFGFEFGDVAAAA